MINDSELRAVKESHSSNSDLFIFISRIVGVFWLRKTQVSDHKLGGQPLSFQRGRGGSSVAFLSGVHIPLVFPMFSSSCTTPFVAIVIQTFYRDTNSNKLYHRTIQARLRWHTCIYTAW